MTGMLKRLMEKMHMRSRKKFTGALPVPPRPQPTKPDPIPMPDERKAVNSSRSPAEGLADKIKENIEDSETRSMILDELETAADEGNDDHDALVNLFDSLQYDSSLDDDGKAVVAKARTFLES